MLQILLVAQAGAGVAFYQRVVVQLLVLQLPVLQLPVLQLLLLQLLLLQLLAGARHHCQPVLARGQLEVCGLGIVEILAHTFHNFTKQSLG